MSQISLKDSLSLEGILEAKAIYLDGREHVFFKDENLIMDRAKAHLLSLVYDRSGEARTDPIKSFRVGAGGVFTGGSASAIKPSNPKATDLYQTLYSASNGLEYNPENISNNRNAQDPAFLTSYSPTDVTFTFGLTPNDLVGAGINEVGLFTASGFLFNHKTFPTIQKTSEFSLQFTWTIKYN